mmetsp:Transcript_8368/g.23994  ORF Transcript_8368/g.23994 Transcript_8368/m.23994 type:complete len:1189 (-) Transcript_8368:69-3635(-)
MAILYHKPVVILALDQEAWDLLTVPGGAEAAKEQADRVAGAESSNSSGPAAEKGWVEKGYGPALNVYEGEHIVPGEPMSLELLRKLYSQLASINICPCRVLEEINLGWPSMLDTALSYISKDLEYSKEHAQLQNKAVAWERAVNSGGPHPLLQEAEAIFWAQWVSRAEQRRQEPPPTEQMKAFIHASQRKSSQRRRRTRVLSIGLVVVLLVGILASTTAAIVATQATAQARDSAEQARVAKLAADRGQALAEERARQAEEAQLVTVASSALPHIGRDPNIADQWELSVAAAAMRAINGTDHARELLAAVSEARALTKADSVRLLLNAGSVVQNFAWSPLPGALAVSAAGSLLLLWNQLGQGPLPGQVRHQSRPWPLSFPRAIAGGENGVVSWLPALAWSPDGRRLVAGVLQQPASGPRACSLALWWDLVGEAEADPLVIPAAVHGEGCSLVEAAFSPDGAFLAAAVGTGFGGKMAGSLAVWRVLGPEKRVAEHLRLDGHYERLQMPMVGTLEDNSIVIPIDSSRHVMAWSPVGALLTSPEEDGSVRVVHAALGGSSNSSSKGSNSTKGAAARVTLLEGHRGKVTNLAWAPRRLDNELQLATASTDGDVRVWKWPFGGSADPTSTVVFSGTTPATQVAWGQGGEWLAAGTADGSVHVRRLSSGASGDFPELGMTFEYEGADTWMVGVLSLAWEPAGNARLAVGRHDGCVYVYNLKSPQVLKLETLYHGHLQDPFRQLRPPLKVAWAQDGSQRLAVSPAVSSEFHLWEIHGGDDPPGGKGLLPGLARAEGYEVAWTASGSLLAVSSVVQTVDVATGRVGFLVDSPLTNNDGEDVPLSSVGPPGPSPFSDLLLDEGFLPSVHQICKSLQQALPGGFFSFQQLQWLSSFSPDCSHLIFPPSPQETTVVSLLRDPGSTMQLEGWDVTAWSRDGWLAAGSRDIAHIWSPEALGIFGDGVLATEPVGLELSLSGNFSSFSGFREMAFSPDGSMVAAGTGDVILLGGQLYHGELCVWRVPGGELLLPELCRESSLLQPVAKISWSPTNSRLAVGLENSGDVLILDGVGWGGVPPESSILPGPAESVTTIAWRHDVVKLAVGYASGSILLWDFASKSFQVLYGHVGKVWSIAWSPDSRLLASGAADGVRLWEHLEPADFLPWFSDRYDSLGFNLNIRDLAEAGIPPYFAELIHGQER